MDIITYNTALSKLAETIEKVCETREPAVIIRNGQQAVVMLSLAEYEALEEAAHVERTRRRSKRLRKAINDLAIEHGPDLTGVIEIPLDF